MDYGIFVRNPEQNGVHSGFSRPVSGLSDAYVGTPSRTPGYIPIVKLSKPKKLNTETLKGSLSFSAGKLKKTGEKV